MAFDNPHIPEIGNILAQHGRGYAMGGQMRQDNAMATAGQALAQGNQKGAVNALYQAGEVESGLKIEDHFRQAARQADADKLAKAERFNRTLGNLAMLADTPEKWTAAIGSAKAAGLDVDKWADFGTRDYVIAQAGKATEALTLELNRRKEQQVLEERTYQRGRDERGDARADRALSLQEKALTIKETPPQYEFTKTGVGNKYTGDFRPYDKGDGADPGLTLEQGKYEQGLRKEYTDLSKDVRAIQDGLGRVQSGAKLESGAGDIAVVYGFMKINDPGSVVRETEYDIAQNVASLPERWRSAVMSMLNGKQLDPRVRQEMVTTARALATDKAGRFQKLRGQFENIAKSGGADPSRIMLDEGMVPDAPSGGANEAPSDAVQLLRSDPTPQRIQQFEEVFGAGSAKRALGR
jgi:hypothetical protein